MLLCFILASFAEVLLRISQRNGGVVFNDDGKLSNRDQFCFRYLPTIIAVVFGLLWASSAHDFRRLEPFFQLSAPEGATAENSLLLDYPYKLLILLPFVAGGRRYVQLLGSHALHKLGL